MGNLTVKGIFFCLLIVLILIFTGCNGIEKTGKASPQGFICEAGKIAVCALSSPSPSSSPSPTPSTTPSASASPSPSPSSTPTTKTIIKGEIFGMLYGSVEEGFKLKTYANEKNNGGIIVPQHVSQEEALGKGKGTWALFYNFFCKPPKCPVSYLNTDLKYSDLSVSIGNIGKNDFVDIPKNAFQPKGEKAPKKDSDLAARWNITVKVKDSKGEETIKDIKNVILCPLNDYDLGYFDIRVVAGYNPLEQDYKKVWNDVLKNNGKYLQIKTSKMNMKISPEGCDVNLLLSPIKINKLDGLSLHFLKKELSPVTIFAALFKSVRNGHSYELELAVKNDKSGNLDVQTKGTETGLFGTNKISKNSKVNPQNSISMHYAVKILAESSFDCLPINGGMGRHEKKRTYQSKGITITELACHVDDKIKPDQKPWNKGDKIPLGYKLVKRLIEKPNGEREIIMGFLMKKGTLFGLAKDRVELMDMFLWIKHNFDGKAFEKLGNTVFCCPESYKQAYDYLSKKIKSSNSKNSVYMVRNSENFNYNGRAYKFSPEYEFNIPVTRDFDYSYLKASNPDNILLMVYEYNEILNDCNYDIVSSKNYNVNSEGKEIIIDGLEYKIPPNAVTDQIDLNIETIELKDCFCNNGIQDNGELGIDCGGQCSQQCPPSCYDNLQNGDEGGIDCGGSCPTECYPEHCENEVQDLDETNIDCGGSCIIDSIDDDDESCYIDENKNCIAKDCDNSCTSEEQCLDACNGIEGDYLETICHYGSCFCMSSCGDGICDEYEEFYDICNNDC
jgi:hypothetical protein